MSENKKYTGIIFVGPLGSGKDFILSRIRKAFDESLTEYHVWNVGDYYYRHLGKQINKSVKYIIDNKAKFRSQLQTIGTTPAIVEQGVAYSLGKYQDLGAWGVLPVLTGRLKNEVIALKELGVAVIFIKTPVETRARRIYQRDGKFPSESQLNHPVEPKFEDFEELADAVIINEDESGDFYVKFNPDVKALTYLNKSCQGKLVFDI